MGPLWPGGRAGETHAPLRLSPACSRVLPSSLLGLLRAELALKAAPWVITLYLSFRLLKPTKEDLGLLQCRGLASLLVDKLTALLLTLVLNKHRPGAGCPWNGRARARRARRRAASSGPRGGRGSHPAGPQPRRYCGPHAASGLSSGAPGEVGGHGRTRSRGS